MPELPEVETVCRGLKKLIAKESTVIDIKVFCRRLREPVNRQEMERLKGSRIQGIERRAKYLIFTMESAVILNHLGMTGTWRSETRSEVCGEARRAREKYSNPRKHDHVALYLANGKVLIYNDPRRFGLLRALKPAELHDRLASLGPEPLDSKAFTAEYVFKQTRSKKVALKIWLMDQKNVVGVGNIYASEALFMARLSPHQKAARVTREQAGAMVKAVGAVLKRAIKMQGTTIRDYRPSEGGSGRFQSALKVYGRKNGSCPICGDPIKVEVIGGRTSYWCRTCQK